MKKKLLLLLLFLVGNKNFYAMESTDLLYYCSKEAKSYGDGQMTPLMLAVKINNVDEVKLLLEKGENTVAYNLQESRFVRDFNLIYDDDRLKKLLLPIVDLKLKLETHNRICQADRRDYYTELIKLPAVIELRNALLIDKILEHTSGIFYINSAFNSFLKHPAVKRAIRTMFKDTQEIEENVPSDISRILVITDFGKI